MGVKRSAILILAALVIFAIHLLSVAHYPAGWYDEIEILEMGRFSIFEVAPDWSVNLFMKADGSIVPPVPYFHYLAGLVQESLYRLTGTFVWARIFFLFSLPICSLALFAWLREHAVGESAAMFAALFFLVDPNATICAHWYRPDLWCMTMALIAALLVRRRHLVAAGGLSAVMLAMWITSMLFLPLIAWEAWAVSDRRGRDAALGILGFAIGMALLMIPLYPQLGAIIAQYREHSELGGTSCGFRMQNVIDFMKIAARSPFIWFAALVGLARGWRRAAMHGVIFVGLVAMMIGTRVYHLRMIYLLPCLFLFAALAIDSLPTKLPRLVAALALVAYFCLSVVGLEYAAWPTGANRLADLQAKLQAPIGGVAKRVYLHDAEHELYYAGRALGWKMYSTMPRGNMLSTVKGRELVASLDAYVVSDLATEPLSAEQNATLQTLGFRKHVRIDLDRGKVGALKARLEQLFYAHGYVGGDIFVKE